MDYSLLSLSAVLFLGVTTREDEDGDSARIQAQ